MGFDIECIIDIHSYPGEYFCPVCRTLVYPNEAFQAQCTHLYCKPCLVHIANGTKTCPYDGYLVTESDSKPLVDCDKALTEKVGKVKVHCLYFRSGCTWEGTLSDCPSHCSGCSFGNSPVVCNRCGIQIVHRQVHDHAQICPGGYDGQHAAVGAAGLTRSGTASTPVTAHVNQSGAQSGAPVPQPPNPQNVSATQLPGQHLQNANTQANANAHTPVVASVAMPAPDQWYQQQYQQYYQQYGGYDPYQQQQYYPPQQQPFQLYQQNALQVQGQHQSHAYSQAQGSQVHPPGPQSHLQLQPPQQTNHATQTAQQPHPQQQTHGQAQPPSQPQLQMLPQVQAQAQLPPQGQAQAHLPPQGQAQAQLPPQGQAQAPANGPVQALPPNYQVNPQQQAHPTMRPQTQIPPQSLPPPPHSQSSQPPQFPQSVGMRPPAHPQHPQVPQYYQGQGQMHHPQGSQAHLQPPMLPQTQAYIQSSSQSNAPSQPHTQLYPSHSQLPVFHPQTNQTAAPNALPQAPYPPVPPASGHHSYQQPQAAQKMQPGASQQHAGPPNMPSGSIHSVQVYGQASQQTTPVRPLHSHGSFSQQQPAAPLPLQNQVPGIPPAPHQQFLPHGQQPTHPTQHHPVIQQIQQSAPPNYAPPQQFSAPYQGQFHQQGHLPQQPLLQSQMQMFPSGPPQPQQPQNYVGIPLQSNPLSSGGFDASGHSVLAQGDPISNQHQNYAKSIVPEQNVSVQEIKSPSKVLVEKGFASDSLKDEVGPGPNGTLVKDADNSAKDGLVKSDVKQEMGDLIGSRGSANVEKPFGAGGVENVSCKDEFRTLSDSVPLNQADSESLMKLSKTAGLSSGNFGDETILFAHSRSSAEGQTLVPQSHCSHQENNKSLPSSTVELQGPGASPHPGKSVNLTDGKGAVSVSGPSESLESLADARGLGKPPPLPFESQFGSQSVVRPGEISMSSDQISCSVELRPLAKSHADGPSHLGKNGGAACDPSMLGTRDANSKALSKEHLNPFAREPTHTSDQASRSLDKTFHGHNSVSKLDTGAEAPPQLLPHHPSGGRGDMIGPGPEFRHHIKPFSYHSPGRDYLGSPSRGGPSSFPRGTLGFEDLNYREAHRFREASKSFNLSSDFARNPFHDGRFPPSRRGDIDDPGNPRFGEHRVPGLLHNQIGGDDVFGPDGLGHVMKGKFPGPGYATGHFNMGETTGHGALSGHGRTGEGTGSYPRPPFPESVRGEMPSFLHHREPLMRNNYPYHGIPNTGQFPGGVNSFDDSRKRKPVSNGWCRICEFDCETVERLEMHSQTREHQNMAMDIVRRIKLQNKKKQRTVGGHMVPEGVSRTRKVGTVGHGNKP